MSRKKSSRGKQLTKKEFYGQYFREAYENLSKQIARKDEEMLPAMYEIGTIIYRLRSHHPEGQGMVRLLALVFGVSMTWLTAPVQVILTWSREEFEQLCQRRDAVNNQPLNWSHIKLLAGCREDHREEMFQKVLAEGWTATKLKEELIALKIAYKAELEEERRRWLALEPMAADELKRAAMELGIGHSYDPNYELRAQWSLSALVCEHSVNLLLIQLFLHPLPARQILKMCLKKGIPRCRGSLCYIPVKLRESGWLKCKAVKEHLPLMAESARRASDEEKARTTNSINDMCKKGQKLPPLIVEHYQLDPDLAYDINKEYRLPRWASSL